jgi:hypothetical protein
MKCDKSNMVLQTISSWYSLTLYFEQSSPNIMKMSSCLHESAVREIGKIEMKF